MIVTAPSQEQSNSQGPRPINMNRDIPQVLKLLELVFGNTLDAESRRMLSQSAQTSQGPPFLWRFSPAASKLSLGFVWEIDNRIVGNVTILTTKTPGRYLIVNVAVHPDYRRQGIARQLMIQVKRLLEARRGNQILLQVVKENEAAIALYHSLCYHTIGSMTSWHASISRLRRLEVEPPHRTAVAIHELRGHEWRQAFALDQQCLPPDLNWPDTLPPDFYRTTLWGHLSNLFNGRRSETWVTHNGQNELTGLVNIFSEWGHTHEVLIRVHPAWQGQLERPLFAKMIRRLQNMPRRNVRIFHPDNDAVMTELLRQANFAPRRTLTHMRLDI